MGNWSLIPFCPGGIGRDSITCVIRLYVHAFDEPLRSVEDVQLCGVHSTWNDSLIIASFGYKKVLLSGST